MSKKEASTKIIADKDARSKLMVRKAPNGIFKMSFFKNFVQLAFIGALLILCLKGNEGYSWVWSDLIHENLKFIRKNRHMSTAQKYQSKFGVDAAALQFIANQTPDTAVLLFPPHRVIMSDSSGYKFMGGIGGIKARVWAEYFLYPRRLVYMDEFDRSTFKNQITHVVCMGSWGYRFLEYPVIPKNSFAVFPVKNNNKNSKDSSIY